MPLARPGDPYVTDKGDVVLPDKMLQGDVLPRAMTLGPSPAKSHLSKQRRSIKDLPADPKLQTAINAVIVYHLLGMTDNEISSVTSIPLEDVLRVKNDIAYQETYEVLFHEFVSVNSNSLQSKIAAYAGDALDNVIKIAENSKHDLAKLKANQDLLDRAGLHPETLFGKNKQDDGFDALKIVITDGRDDEPTKVDINVTRK